MNETLTCALGAMDTIDLFVALGGTAVATAIVVSNHVGRKYMRRIEALSPAATSMAIIIRAELDRPGTIKANAARLQDATGAKALDAFESMLKP